jgi:protein TilB
LLPWSSRVNPSNIVNEALLRKRAEHNDGELSTLREISLHQFDIEKIENLDVYCRKLEILLLQSNQISKIENLSKLKSLEYLQLALNNISLIENLDKCESLKKLDLTVNFVADLRCVKNLASLEFLRELYLIGNPCTEIHGYRSFVIATLPQLQMLDGIQIEKSERILAAQEYKSILERLNNMDFSKPPTSEPQTMPSRYIKLIVALKRKRSAFMKPPLLIRQSRG